MKISNPCLEDFKIKITATKLKKHKLEKKNVFSSCFIFKIFVFFSSTTKTVLLQDFKIWVCMIFFGKTENNFGKDFISPIFSATATWQLV